MENWSKAIRKEKGRSKVSKVSKRERETSKEISKHIYIYIV